MPAMQKVERKENEKNEDQRLTAYVKQMDFLVQELSDRWDVLDESLRQDYFAKIENFKELINGVKIKRVFE